MIFLDSDIIIYSQKGLITLSRNFEYLISPIVYSELLYGFLDAGKSRRELDTYLESDMIEAVAITLETVAIFTKIKLDLSKKGQVIMDNDILVASSALEYQMPLWTNNKKHFKRINGLSLI